VLTGDGHDGEAYPATGLKTTTRADIAAAL
jgi:hypothetical protein